MSDKYLWGELKTEPAYEGQEPLFIKELEKLRADNKKLKVALKNFLKKTRIYLEVYPDDKELRRYRDNAEQALEEVGEE